MKTGTRKKEEHDIGGEKRQRAFWVSECGERERERERANKKLGSHDESSINRDEL